MKKLVLFLLLSAFIQVSASNDGTPEEEVKSFLNLSKNTTDEKRAYLCLRASDLPISGELKDGKLTKEQKNELKKADKETIISYLKEILNKGYFFAIMYTGGSTGDKIANSCFEEYKDQFKGGYLVVLRKLVNKKTSEYKCSYVGNVVKKDKNTRALKLNQIFPN